MYNAALHFRAASQSPGILQLLTGVPLEVGGLRRRRARTQASGGVPRWSLLARAAAAGMDFAIVTNVTGIISDVSMPGMMELVAAGT